MKLDFIHIKNFRGIKDLHLNFEEVTVLIGENNTGKSSVLEALYYCLGRVITGRRAIFTEFDFHLTASNSQPSDSEPIGITLKFCETREDEWPVEVTQQLGRIIQIEDNDLSSITLQIDSKFDSEVSTIVTDWNFLDRERNILTSDAKNIRNIINLQKLSPVFYLSALRDAGQEFRSKSMFWGPFVKSAKMDDEIKDELEQKLADLNTEILEQYSGFNDIKERINQVSKHVSLPHDEATSIDALPAKAFEILSRTQVNLKSNTGANLPIKRHGEGTQSLAVMALFDTFLKNRLVESYDEHTEPFLALEEPEAHLHPSAIRSMCKLLKEMDGQKLISTHSGEIISGISLFNLRRLRRVGGDIKAYQLNPNDFNPHEINKLNYEIRASQGNLLFSRCWLLVEGETEFRIFNECSRILGKDLTNLGISCIEYSQTLPETLLKTANSLGIEWLFQTDGDTAGDGYKRKATSHLSGRSASDHIMQLPEKDMEVFLCKNGFGYLFENNISPQKRATITASQGTDDYWEQVVKARTSDFSKPKAAMEIIDIIEGVEVGPPYIPMEIQNVINKAIEIADGVS